MVLAYLESIQPIIFIMNDVLVCIYVYLIQNLIEKIFIQCDILDITVKIKSVLF